MRSLPPSPPPRGRGWPVLRSAFDEGGVRGALHGKGWVPSDAPHLFFFHDGEPLSTPTWQTAAKKIMNTPKLLPLMKTFEDAAALSEKEHLSPSPLLPPHLCRSLSNST